MKLTDQDLQKRLEDRPGWAREGDAIVRTFTFAGFPDAIAFVTRLAFEAEANDHHPDLSISYRKVRVSWSTHSEGGVTGKDFDGARQSDMIASRLSGPKA
jgi:4a-hydroxytetrahydrobiopterin dehydratase